ncbi:hypothetical protein [Herbidospora cretacea]|uniref:hypothetical protein n=1 Tax=Herbidospora cretacea TaxID=28444 RepID=UPI000773508D|nr:hypothetical protein [Herbidospora cretacea]
MVSRRAGSLEMLIPAGAAMAVGAVAVVAMAVPQVSERVAAMAAMSALIGLVVRRPVAAGAAAVVGWFLMTGFLVNGLGELTFARADWLRLALLAGAGLVGSAMRTPMPLRVPARVPVVYAYPRKDRIAHHKTLS